jgi:hypothetical protein
MKKMFLFIVAVSLGGAGAFADDSPVEKRANMLDYIAKLKAQEYVRELVQAKFKLMDVSPNATGEEILAIRGHVAAINRELLALVTLPLQTRKKELEKVCDEQKKTMSEQNPRMLQIKDEITRIDMEIARAKAELVDSIEMK